MVMKDKRDAQSGSKIAGDCSRTLTQRKRASILAASIREFGDHGYAGARIDRIAEQANISKRTLYKHFASKQSMFDAIVAKAAMPLPQSDAPPFDPARPLAVQLSALLGRYMDVVATDDYVTVSRILVAEFIADPKKSEGAARHEGAAAGPIEDLIAQAIANGLIREVDPGYAATQITGMLKAFFFWPRFLTGSDRPEPDAARTIIADCVAMFLAHYATSP